MRFIRTCAFIVLTGAAVLFDGSSIPAAASTPPPPTTSAVAEDTRDPVLPRQGARPTVQFGDGTIHVDRLKPYENAWLVTLRNRKTGAVLAERSIWTETLLPAREADGREVFSWSSSAVVYRGGGDIAKPDLAKMTMRVASNLDIFDAKTLAPIRSWHHFVNGEILGVSVDGTHVDWSDAASETAAPETHRFDLPAPAYDLDGGFFAVLAPLVDLRVGNSGVLPGVGDKDTPVKGYSFRVVRRETIQAGYYGSAETTVVEIYEPRSDELFTFWVVDRPPYVLRFTVPGDTYDQDFEELGHTGPIDWNFPR